MTRHRRLWHQRVQSGLYVYQVARALGVPCRVVHEAEETGRLSGEWDIERFWRDYDDRTRGAAR